MTDLINYIQNKVLDTFNVAAPRQVVAAIRDASEGSGVDFAYLLQQARAESSFDADVKAKTSSATGLFQFIESTWMNMVDRYGEKLGIDTAQDKQSLLELRKDPQIASQMAAEFAGENARYLDRNWGGDVGATELYFAHFLGAGQASAFLNAKDQNGSDPAAVLFPKAAAANQNVFYDKSTGRAKSLDEVYAFFDRKFKMDSKDFMPSDAQDVQIAEADTDANVNEVVASGAQVFKVAKQTTAPANQDEQIAQAQNNIADVIAKMNNRAQFNAREDVPPTLNSLLYNQLDLILMTQMDLPLGANDSNKRL